MDKFERVNQRARHAMVQVLTMAKQPKSEDAALTDIRRWEQLSYRELTQEVEECLQRFPWVNAGMVWYMRTCIAEAERVRSQRSKILELINV